MNANVLLLSVVMPLLAGGLCLILPKTRRFVVGGIISTFITACVFALAIHIWLLARVDPLVFRLEWLSAVGIEFSFFADRLNALVLLVVAAFGFLISLFSISYMRGKPRLNEYYAYFLFTVGAAAGALLASNLILLLLFWEILGITLYGLVGIYGSTALPGARKSLLMVGGADFFLLLGIGLLYSLTRTFEMNDIVGVSLGSPVAVAAFLFIAVGAFTKAGVMPFHTWIPAASLGAPLSVMALLPGSLDKLLGIYLLSRISLDFFELQSAAGLSTVLMSIGALTIVVGAIMALLQKDLRRALAYLAISSSGYMVLGLGTATRLGTVGGLFHMLNGALYMALLFLVAGSIEKKTGRTSLEELGGLSHMMPLTFVLFLVGGLAMSGVPPLSGFFSKWMIYQGVISVADQVGAFPIFLLAALFGSVLTLACFLKLTHSLFLSSASSDVERASEVGFLMGLPKIVLALVSVLFGVFAYALPLRQLIIPAVRYRLYESGLWRPDIAALLLLVGLLVGLLFYLLVRAKPKTTGSFIGGELLSNEEVRIPGTDFYESSVRSIDIVDKTYQVGEQGAFDIFVQGMVLLRAVGRFLHDFIDRPVDRFYDVVATHASLLGRGLSVLHTGGLRFYLAWVLGLGGTLILVLVLLFG